MTGGFVQWVNVFFSYSNHQRLLCHSSHFAVVISPSNIILTIQKLHRHFHKPTRVTLKNFTPIFWFFNKRQGKSGHLNSCESAGNFWAVPEHKQICGQAFGSRFQRPEASPSLIRSFLVFPPQLRSKESSLPSPAPLIITFSTRCTSPCSEFPYYSILLCPHTQKLTDF